MLMFNNYSFKKSAKKLGLHNEKELAAMLQANGIFRETAFGNLVPNHAYKRWFKRNSDIYGLVNGKIYKRYNITKRGLKGMSSMAGVLNG